MRLERLVIDAGDQSLGVDFHPKLTVISGLGRLEREGLTAELMATLTSARPGVHLEFVDGIGRHLALFRPQGDRHRLIDIDRSQEVTGEFVGADGAIDVLHQLGLEGTDARRLMHLGAADLQVSDRRDEMIDRLAAVDQSRLWVAAEKRLAAAEVLNDEAQAMGSAPEDAEVIDAVESSHASLERALAHKDRIRQAAVIVGTLAGIVAGIMTTAISWTAGIPLLVVAFAASAVAIIGRLRVNRAEKALERAVSEAGAHSYLGFHLQRVNGLLGSDSDRGRLMKAADEHRQAVEEWQAMAGDIAVEFAIAQREKIEAASRIHRNVADLTVLSTTSELSGEDSNALAQALLGRLSELRTVGATGEALPLVLDEPFERLASDVKPLLLELLSNAAGSPQLIFLTEDDDVASWARLEAMTGELAILDLAPTPNPSSRQTTETIIL